MSICVLILFICKNTNKVKNVQKYKYTESHFKLNIKWTSLCKTSVIECLKIILQQIALYIFNVPNVR